MTERRKIELPSRRSGKTEATREMIKKAIEDGKNIYLPESPAIDGDGECVPPKQEDR